MNWGVMRGLVYHTDLLICMFVHMTMFVHADACS